MAARRSSAPSRSLPGAPEHASASAASGRETRPASASRRKTALISVVCPSSAPHDLGERRQKTRVRRAGGESTLTGGKEAAEEIVAGGR